jgi:hypothetical protein
LNEIRAFLLLEPTPSEADIKITRDLIRAGQLLKIEILDHIVIRNPNHISLRTLGYFAVELIMPSSAGRFLKNLRDRPFLFYSTRHYLGRVSVGRQLRLDLLAFSEPGDPPGWIQVWPMA